MNQNYDLEARLLNIIEIPPIAGGGHGPIKSRGSTACDLLDRSVRSRINKRGRKLWIRVRFSVDLKQAAQVSACLLALLVCSTAWSGEPLISSNTTVVLVSGLAGDAESESAYQEHLQAWLEVIAKQQPRKCVVLFGAPFSSSQPNLQRVEPDREHFLRLPSLLGDSADPVTVIVWGHGGKQGAASVFHVRGPRITADDMSDVAAKLHTINSRWVLMFRGSGAFARRLAGNGREILSSENSTTFGSDPVSLPLLARLIRQTPDASLEHLAHEFGPATADWYAERSLARAEEPTLWLQGQQPRGLTERQVAFKHSEEPAPPSVARSATDGHAPPVQPVAAATGWDQIRKVSQQDYPDADAVILRSRQVSALGSTPALVTEREEFIQILKPEGKRFGDFDVTFFPPAEELDFMTCEVLGPDGKVARMDPRAIGVSVEHSLGDVQAPRRKFFSMPGVQPGAVLHVRYRSEWREYPLPRVSMEIPLARELPIAECSLEVRVPRDWPFHYRIDGLAPIDPAVTRTDYATNYSWQWTNVPADLSEALSAPHRRAGLSISTFKDWREFADWYSHISKLADETGPEVVEKARELSKGAGNDKQKVERIYRYVTGLRYVAIPLGINSVRPHAAANVLQNQFGDCKDKANLLDSLLHAVNLQADLVLVPRFKEAYDGLPGFAFNHAISRVTLGNEVLWLDSTDEACRFGLLPPGDAGRNVMVLDSTAAGLTRLPLPQAGEHRLVLRGEIEPSEAGKEWALKLTASAGGCVDYQLRNDSREMRSPASSLPLLEARYHPVCGSFALVHQTASSPSAMDSDFQWRAEGTCIGVVSIAPGRCVVHAPFWLPKEWEIALNRRKSPLFLNDGYPLALDEEFKIAIPSDSQKGELPARSAGEKGPLRWQVSWTRAEDGKLVARLRADLSSGDLSPSQTADFQTQTRELLDALASDVVLSPSTPLTQR